MTETKPDSEHEFEWWAEELIKRGYIDNIKHHPQAFLLTPKAHFEYSEVKVTKRGVGTKSGTGFLMYEWTYTPDFGIWWNKKAYGLLYYNMGEGHNLKETILYGHDDMSLVESKPDYMFRKEGKLFSMKQKAMWNINKLYVNLCNFPKFFSTTFVPEKYLCTDVHKKLKADYQRKKPRMIDEFLEMRIEWQRKKIG